MTVRETFVPGEPCWADCLVTDLDGARRFYGEVFGWSFAPADPHAPYVYAYLDGRRVAGLNPVTPASPMAPAWHVYLSTDDLDATAGRVGGLGGTLLMGPADTGPAELPAELPAGRFAIARDPAGAVVAFWQPAGRPGLEVSDDPGAMTWHELWVRDAAAADAFYGGLFGYALTPVGPGGVYLTLDVAGVARAGRFRLGGVGVPDEVEARWVVYLAVADCDAAFGTAVAAGAKPVREPDDSPRGRWAILRDPWGAVFALLTRQ